MPPRRNRVSRRHVELSFYDIVSSPASTGLIARLRACILLEELQSATRLGVVAERKLDACQFKVQIGKEVWNAVFLAQGQRFFHYGKGFVRLVTLPKTHDCFQACTNRFYGRGIGGNLAHYFRRNA